MTNMQGVAARPEDETANAVDPALAVDRAFTLTEREMFSRRQLHGNWNGAHPADWLDMAHQTDAYLEVVEPWWERHGADTVEAIRARSELPQRISHALVAHALLACIALGIVDVHTPAQAYVYGLAERAALWTRGKAEGHGWSPAEPESEPS